MIRKATAVWKGTGRDGTGHISSESGVLADTPYSFKTRFEEGKGTNPEELLAAAHAGCFTMALSAQLIGAGFTADSLDTTCAISLEKDGEGFSIAESHLELKARIPGIAKEQFDELVNAAKT